MKSIVIFAFLGLAFSMMGGEEDIVIKNQANHRRQATPFKPLSDAFPGVDIKERTHKFLVEQFGDIEYVITDQYTSKHNGVTHTYMKQLVNGKKVFNGDMNINTLGDGSIINFAENFFKGNSIEFIPKFNVIDALKSFATKRNIVLNGNIEAIEGLNGIITVQEKRLSEYPISVEFGYVHTEQGTLDLAWQLTVREPISWFYVIVSASSNEIVTMIDWTHAESYEVYPLGTNDPSDGPRTIEVDPSFDGGFELGWHSTGSTNYTVTQGNNVITLENIQPLNPNKYQPDAGASLDFIFPMDLNEEPITYLDASMSNLFYTCNIVHDIFYPYGFDESSGNFQENNFGLGGRENDPVIAYAQDGLGVNNAMFSTPPDGSSGTMRMYLWNRQTPMIDGSLDNGVIIHEYGHGINIRLAGGPSNSNCMSGGESGGMGEGWGDCWSLMLRWRDEYNMDTVFEMGDYVNGGNGIRLYPYAYNMTVNPQTYEYINRPEYSGVHAKGTFFCAAVYDIFLTMVDKYGFENYYDATNQGGNNVLLQDMVDSLKMQPCRPTMIDTRDSLIMANEINYGGAHVCDYWRQFARRGLGEFARSNGSTATEDFTVPSQCR